MKKRFLATLMSMVMIATSLVGCGTEERLEETSEVVEETSEVVEETSEVVEEATSEEVVEEEINPVTISMLFCDSSTEPYTEDWLVLDMIEEATGVTFDMTVIPSSDFGTKRELVFNSGEIPDIVAHTSATSAWISAGLLLPISEYEDQMPNYQAWIEETGYRNLIDGTKSFDGNYYSLPTKAMDYTVQELSWMVRTDIFEENNLEIPTTYEELLEVGITLKEIYPDSTPISNRFTSKNIYSGMSAMFGAYAGWNYGNGMIYDYDNEEWFFTATTDEYYNFVSYAHDLYEAGVLDQEFTTQDSTIYEQKIIMGESFIMFDWASNLTRYNTQGVDIDDDFNVSLIYPIEGTDGNYAISWKAGWDQNYVLPATLAEDEEHLAEVLDYLDWGYTEEAQTIMTFGIEGETYEVVDGVKISLSTTPMADWGMCSGELCIRQDLDFILGGFSEADRAIYDQIGADGIVAPLNPAAPLDDEQIEKTAIYTTVLTDYVMAMTDKFVMGEESLDNWDEFVAECINKGSADLEAEYRME
ncbi:MAG: extracellular solute-binding protein [Lachnospiraceae bacterium]